jgi:DoxX-like protein
MSGNVLNLVLWSVQVFLALFFLGAGAPKIIGRGIERWTGFSDLARPLTVVIGFTEILGAAGLVLPMATGILPWLTPLAAVGLAVIVLMAAGFHTRADERLAALETGLWAGTAAVVAIGRWDLVASRADVAPWMVVAAIGVLIPSVIINIIVLLTRPVKSGTRESASGISRLPVS